MFTIDRVQLRAEYEKWMKTLPTRYLLTITFPNTTPERVSKDLLNKLIIHLNRRIYKKRYGIGESHLKGLAIREVTHTWESDHFHILILDDLWLPNLERMRLLIQKQIDYFYGRPEDYKTFHIDQDFDLQEYYEKSLERYVTKTFEKYSLTLDQVTDCIGILGPGKVEFGRDRFTQRLYKAA